MKKFFIAALLLTTTVASSGTYAAPISQGCSQAIGSILNIRNVTEDDLAVKANQDRLTNVLLGNADQLELIVQQCETSLWPFKWFQGLVTKGCERFTDDCTIDRMLTDICKSRGLCVR